MAQGTHQRVHLWILKYCKACSRRHRPIKKRVDGHADYTDLMTRIRPAWCSREDVIEEFDEVREVSYCRNLPCRVFQVILAIRNLPRMSTRGTRGKRAYLREHQIDEHPQPRILLDLLLELLHHRREFLGVLIDMIDRLVEEFMMMSLVL